MRFVLLVLLTATLLFGQFENYRVSPSNTYDPEEVSIAINPLDRNIVAVGANISYFYVSTDGGVNWNMLEMSSSYGVWGDPSLVYDTEGNLYFGHLSNPTFGYWIDRIVVQKSTDNGTTWDNGEGIGLTAPRNQDKEWLAVDHTQSPYRNYVYTCWTEFDTYGSTISTDSTRILFSRTTNGGSDWSEPVRVSDIGGNCIDEDETVEGAVPAVGPDGEIYTAWSGPLGIMFDRSFDGGETFGNDIFVSDQPGGWNFDIPAVQRCNGMPVTACDVSNSQYRGRVYVLWSDQRNGENNTDVFLKYSDDKGSNWSDMVKVNTDQSGRHQFFPWMAVDSTTGYIYSVFYDRRNTAGNNTDVYVARSTNGGASFTNHKISNSSFNPGGNFIGDYISIAADSGYVYPVWTRGDNGALSVWTAPIDDNSNVLPVELAQFSAQAFGKDVKIYWQTASEVNNSHFEIERRSEKSSNWQTIDRVEGNGTSGAVNNYNYTDYTPGRGMFYYRLKQVDFSGAVNYSEVVEIFFENVTRYKLTKNFPNPFNPSTMISYEIPEDVKVSLDVYNILGQKVATLVNSTQEAGTHTVKFNAADLSAGVYIYTLSAGNKVFSEKMILMK